MKKLIDLTLNDFKLIYRTPSLRAFLVMPGIIFIVVLVLLPMLVENFPSVEPYLPPILIVATFELTQMFGFIYCMVLIEEKETAVAKIYGVLPVSKIGFVLARLFIPTLITTVLTFILLEAQTFYPVAVVPNLVFSLIGGLLVPVYILGISVLAKNRMAGMVWIKVFNIAVVVPVIAFFIPQRFTPLFGIFPTHWPYQGFFSLLEGEAFLWQLIIGLFYLGGLLVIAVRKFALSHFV